MKVQRIYKEGTYVDFEYNGILRKGKIINASKNGSSMWDFYIVKVNEDIKAYLIGGYAIKKIYTQ